MPLVLIRRVAENGLGQTLRFHGEAAEVELGFLLFLALYNAAADDHTEAAEVLPALGTGKVLRHIHLITGEFLVATEIEAARYKDAIACIHFGSGTDLLFFGHRSRGLVELRVIFF